MTSSDAGPTYYTPTYGLPSRDEPADTSDGSPTVTATWRAPGSSRRGPIDWKPLPQRNTPYPWEESRPQEPWERKPATVHEGALPPKPAPMPAPQPAAPLAPVEIEHRGTPPAPPTETVPSAVPVQPTPARTGRVPYAKDNAGMRGPRQGSLRTAPGPAPMDFPPPSGPPVRSAAKSSSPSRRAAAVTPTAGSKKGSLPWLQIILTGIVLLEPAAALIPLIGALILIVTSKQYRKPTTRVVWGVVVIALTIVFLIIRAAVG